MQYDFEKRRNGFSKSGILSLLRLQIVPQEGDRVSRTTIYADIAMNAFTLVDDRQGFSHGDGALLTGTDAFLTSDAADITVLSGSGARPFILAADGYRSGDRHKFQKFLRTDFDALAAAVALGPVYGNDAVLELESSEGAYGDTVTESQTSESTGVGSAKKSGRRMAAAGAKVHIALTGLLAGALASKYGDFLFRNGRFFAQDLGNLTGAVHTTYRTEGGIGTVLGKIIGIAFASGKSAAAAVGTRKCLQDLFFGLVLFYGKDTGDQYDQKT